ncbi:MAG: hypothetical protein GEU76_04800 [Alphaproteobacteria bacterium]|nr:hypothetical protein [Alphaproteobacteria bacterium]
MNREFTRKELYELVWAQPMKVVASSIGISDVALAKQCKKANIPAPSRGYWARKQAGKPTIQVALPPRFPGSSDRVGGSSRQGYYFFSDWAEKFREVPVPPVPIFDEDISSVRERAQKLVGKIRRPRHFDPAHPLVAKLLAHDEERRKEYLKWGSSYYAPKYDSGAERRRLLILNALFMAATRLGGRPSMRTSKYVQDTGSDREIGISIGETYVQFTIEPIETQKGGKRERLHLAFGTAGDKGTRGHFREDDTEGPLESRLTEILVEMLVVAEVRYRESLVRHRKCIIGRKAEAEAELVRRREEAERKARELEEKAARERIQRLLREARALELAERIRAYVRSASARIAELSIKPDDFRRWADWARQEADRIDPVRNGTIRQAIPSDPAARQNEQENVPD